MLLKMGTYLPQIYRGETRKIVEVSPPSFFTSPLTIGNVPQKEIIKFIFQALIFRGKLAVSFREGNFPTPPPKKNKQIELCSKPYCGPLIPQSVSRHLDAGRLINFFIWHSSCCQLHTSVPIKDHCFHLHEHSCCCFLAGMLPCSALWRCLLPCAKVPAPGRRLDVVPHAAQLVLKTRHSLGASSYVGDPERSSLQPSRSARQIALR